MIPSLNGDYFLNSCNQLIFVMETRFFGGGRDRNRIFKCYVADLRQHG
jgi:hypothetical protein